MHSNTIDIKSNCNCIKHATNCVILLNSRISIIILFLRCDNLSNKYIIRQITKHEKTNEINSIIQFILFWRYNSLNFLSIISRFCRFNLNTRIDWILILDIVSTNIYFVFKTLIVSIVFFLSNIEINFRYR